jgi:drug/metabolite transporter (DMT)-like permease
MLGGAAIYSLKNLRRNTNALSIFASFSVFGAVFALAPPLDRLRRPRRRPDWLLPPATAWPPCSPSAIAGMAGQMFFTHGYGYTSIALGTLMSLSVPAIAAVGGWAFLREPLTKNFLLGAVMIMTACGILQYREAVERRALVGPPQVVGELPADEAGPARVAPNRRDG